MNPILFNAIQFVLQYCYTTPMFTVLLYKSFIPDVFHKYLRFETWRPKYETKFSFTIMILIEAVARSSSVKNMFLKIS